MESMDEYSVDDAEKTIADTKFMDKELIFSICFKNPHRIFKGGNKRLDNAGGRSRTHTLREKNWI
jgi:hypothetical protein